VAVAQAGPIPHNPGDEAQVFVRGGDNALWHISSGYASGFNLFGGTSPWSAWSSLGGYLTSAPAAANNPNEQITAFVRGGDNALWSTHENRGLGVWNDWTPLGGAMNGPPFVSIVFNPARSTLEEDVLYRGLDNAAWFDLETTAPANTVAFPPTSWSNPVSIGGYIISNPTMVRNSTVSDLEVFAAGGDNALWVTVSNNGSPYGAWQSLGGFVVGDPAAAFNRDGTIDVFAIGADGTLSHIRQSTPGSWQ